METMDQSMQQPKQNKIKQKMVLTIQYTHIQLNDSSLSNQDQCYCFVYI